MRLLLPAFLVATACAPQPSASPWPEASALFHVENRWIGGDGAVTIDLGNDRILWLFGDSFIANTPERTRDNARMVRNSAALQTGRDPANAFMRFYWRGEPGEATSWFPEDGDRWFWPGQGARLDDDVLIFYGRIFQQGEGAWGFAGEGWTATLAGPVDSEPSEWTFSTVRLPGNTHGITVGMAVLVEGTHLYAYGEKGKEHSLYVVRWDRDAAAQGDLSTPEWWCGMPKKWAGDCDPVSIGPGAPEMSVQRDPRGQGYILVDTEGFGASRIGIRTASHPEGPWSATRIVYDPPESHEPDALVYAAKAHPGLSGADLVVTYVSGRVYFPQFVKLDWDAP